MDGAVSRKPDRIRRLAAFLNTKTSSLSFCSNLASTGLRQYGTKIFGKREHPHARIAKRSVILSSAVSLVGAMVGIISIGFVTSHFSLPLLLAPFGASAVLLFSVYDSPLAQPRNTLFGHILSALIAGAIAVIHASYFGHSDGSPLGEDYVWIAVSVAVSIFAMQTLRLTHPPAGATAFIASTAVSTIDSLAAFMVPVVIGSIILIAVAIVFNNAIPKRRYPVYW